MNVDNRTSDALPVVPRESSRLRAEMREEFPFATSVPEDAESRRDFLKVMGASLALAGAAGCNGRPAEKIAGYVRTPEQGGRGKPLQYATTATLDGHGIGLLVTSHEGRPTKIEGNPDHPESLGSTDAVLQSHVLSLYDPDRSQAVSTGGTIASWSSFLADLRSQLAVQKGKDGAGLRILSGPISSPTLLAQREQLLETFPEAKWYEYSPLVRTAVRTGCEMAFGEPLEPVYDLSKADVVVSLGADLFGTMPGSVRHTRGFAARRSVSTDEGAAPWMSRLYAFESTLTTFGTTADHRRTVTPAELVDVARAIAEGVGAEVSGADSELPEDLAEYVAAAVADLKEYRAPDGEGGPLLVAGEDSDIVSAYVHAANAALGAVGTTVRYVTPAASAGGFVELRELVDEMQDDAVDALLVFGVNPVYDAPTDLGFLEALDKVGWRTHFGPYRDETSANCHWHLPATHFLEEWSDARAVDGTTSIVQPLIAPLYDGRSLHEVLDALVNESPPKGDEIVRAFWEERFGDEFETKWATALHDGLVEGTAAEATDVTARLVNVEKLSESSGFTAVFRPDPYVLDGRFANNAWLQELPRSFTALTWGNAAWLSPVDCERLGVKDGDHVEVRRDDAVVTLPAVRVPGQAESTVTLFLGHGRRRAGRVGTDVGVDVSPLRSSGFPSIVDAVDVRKVTGRTKLAVTQLHHQISTTAPGSFVERSIEHRNVVRHGTLAEWAEHPDDPHFLHVDHHTVEEHPHGEEQPSFYPIEKAEDYEPHEWGMQIDLTRCIGCNACTVACQSENNIPTVGREQVLVGREMHWIRVDSYFTGEPEHPAVNHQPVPCMHCEHAPCEPVCPVAATTHSDEGLNEMTYNRCIGTRYCANNCPYKVRRFNFLEYNEAYVSDDLPVLDLLPNPNVTVRSRGVMEKCTYCVQRISTARIDAQISGDGVIPDGELVTACQQSCPAEAIVFGNIADPESAVSRAKSGPLDYALLEEVNTRPRTTYAARVRNPNPDLPEAHEADAHDHEEGSRGH